MNMEFNSLEELYNRLKPALKTKVIEMHRLGFNYITETDVWNYLKEIKWSDSSNLLLYQMVSDVLNIDNIKLDEYLKSKLNMTQRHIYFE